MGKKKVKKVKLAATANPDPPPQSPMLGKEDVVSSPTAGSSNAIVQKKTQRLKQKLQAKQKIQGEGSPSETTLPNKRTLRSQVPRGLANLDSASPTAGPSNVVVKKASLHSKGSTYRAPSAVSPDSASPIAGPSNVVVKRASPPDSKGTTSPVASPVGSDSVSPIAGPSNMVVKKASPLRSKGTTYQVPSPVSSDPASPIASPSKVVVKKASPPDSKGTTSQVASPVGSDSVSPIAGPSNMVVKKPSPSDSKGTTSQVASPVSSDSVSPIAGPSNMVVKKPSPVSSDQGSPVATSDVPILQAPRSASKALQDSSSIPTNDARARETTPGDSGSHPNSSSSLVRLSKSAQKGKSSTRRERVQSEYYIDPDDNWPPGWSHEKKRKTNPIKWPLEMEDWAKFYDLCQVMAEADSPKALDIVGMIVEAGIWDVSHPAWSYKHFSKEFHPDRMKIRFLISKEMGVKLDDKRMNATYTMCTKAYQSKLVNRFTIVSVLTVAKIAHPKLGRSPKRLEKRTRLVKNMHSTL
jgi:hypothetical protein